MCMKQIVTDSMIKFYDQLIRDLMNANNITLIEFEEGDPLYYAAGAEFVQIFEGKLTFMSLERNGSIKTPERDLYWYWLRDTYSRLLHMIYRK